MGIKRISYSIVKIELTDFSTLDEFRSYRDSIGAKWDEKATEYLWNCKFGIYPRNPEITGKIRKIWFDAVTWWSLAYENETCQVFYESFLWFLKNIPTCPFGQKSVEYYYEVDVESDADDLKFDSNPEIDQIVNKMMETGFSSLSSQEKETYLNSILDKISKKDSLNLQEKKFLELYE